MNWNSRKERPKFRLVFGFVEGTQYVEMKGDVSYYKIIIMLLKVYGSEQDILSVVLDFSVHYTQYIRYEHSYLSESLALY